MKQLSNQQRMVVIIAVAVFIVAGIVVYGLLSRNDAQPAADTRGSDQRSQSPDGDSAPTESSIGTPSTFSRSKAEQIATDEFGGTVKSTEDDHHNGRPTWEVELRDSREGRIEVEVDKETGEILSWEHD